MYILANWPFLYEVYFMFLLSQYLNSMAARPIEEQAHQVFSPEK